MLLTLLSDEGNLSAFLTPGGFFHSNIIQQKLITHFVPFLPLSRHHVERCARSQLCLRGVCSHNNVVEKVGGAMIYTPDQGQYFSSVGCKTVPAKINLFLWAEGAAIYWYLRTERKALSEINLWKEKDLCILNLSKSASPSLRSELYHGRQGFRAEDAPCAWKSNGSELTRPQIQSG